MTLASLIVHPGETVRFDIKRQPGGTFYLTLASGDDARAQKPTRPHKGGKPAPAGTTPALVAWWRVALRAGGLMVNGQHVPWRSEWPLTTLIAAGVEACPGTPSVNIVGLGRFLTDVGYLKVRLTQREPSGKKNRPNGYWMGDLEQARRRFEATYPESDETGCRQTKTDEKT